MRIPQLVSLILVALAAGGSGFVARGWHDRSMDVLPPGEMPPADSFFSSNSFSEIETAKSVLEALSTQFLTENRIRRGLIYMKSISGGSLENPVRQARVAEVLKELEHGIGQFKGTEQELYLVQDMLWVLKKEKFYDRWLDLYLRTLYQHPMDDFAGHYANEAIMISQVAGREEEVLDGLKHLCGIPLEFDAKHNIEAALIQHSTVGQLVRNDGDDLQ
jgi:hypothetical protein